MIKQEESLLPVLLPRMEIKMKRLPAYEKTRNVPVYEMADESFAIIEEITKLYKERGEATATPMKFVSIFMAMTCSGPLPITVDMRCGGIPILVLKINEA